MVSQCEIYPTTPQISEELKSNGAQTIGTFDTRDKFITSFG